MKESGIVAERLKALRESVKLSQAKLAVKLELEQTAIFRYESKTSFPPYSALIRYADYFDVSLDYIFGRTDKPQGKLYDYNPKAFDDEKMQQFVEMCFDPKSPANAKLKETFLWEMRRNDGCAGRNKRDKRRCLSLLRLCSAEKAPMRKETRQ